MTIKEVVKPLRSIKIPCIYKHFKGKYYATMFTSRPINYEKLKTMCVEQNINNPIKCIFMKANYTENDKVIALLKLNEIIYHLEDQFDGQLAIYKSLYDNAGAYARPLDMFLSEVDKEKYPNVTQEYRMEEFMIW